jgi:probable HAF family extracellular repeat protein
VGASERTATHCGGGFPQFVAVIWGPNLGEISELPPLPGDTLATAGGINDIGDVVGTSGNCELGPIEAVVWQNRKPINLGTLGGAVFNIAFGINNRGQVVGQSDLAGDTTHHAFLWENGVMTDLGTLGELPVSLATSINSKTQVVGFSQDPDGSNTVACLWENGTVIDLNTLIPADSPWFLIEALGINDRGQIVGFAFNTTTQEAHGFMATPCEGDRANAEGCINTSAGKSKEKSHVVLPENIRQLLQQRLSGRFHISTPRN